VDCSFDWGNFVIHFTEKNLDRKLLFRFRLGWRGNFNSQRQLILINRKQEQFFEMLQNSWSWRPVVTSHDWAMPKLGNFPFPSWFAFGLKTAQGVHYCTMILLLPSLLRFLGPLGLDSETMKVFYHRSLSELALWGFPMPMTVGSWVVNATIRGMSTKQGNLSQ